MDETKKPVETRESHEYFACTIAGLFFGYSFVEQALLTNPPLSTWLDRNEEVKRYFRGITDEINAKWEDGKTRKGRKFLDGDILLDSGETPEDKLKQIIRRLEGLRRAVAGEGSDSGWYPTPSNVYGEADKIRKATLQVMDDLIKRLP